MARAFKRKIGTATFAANSISRIDLPRNHVFRGLLLRLSGTINVTGAGTVLHDEQPQSLLRDVRIVRNGSEILQALDGGTLFRIAAINWGTPPARTALAGTGIAATAFSCDIPIDFASIGLMPQPGPNGGMAGGPSVSLLRAVGTSSLTIEITWGDTTSIIGGATSTFTVTPTVLVEGIEIMDIAGVYSDKIHHRIERTIAATTTEFEVDLPTGPLYRRLFLKATDSPANGPDFNLSDAVVTDIKAILDGTLYLFDRVTWNGLRGLNKLQYANEALNEGYAVLDFAEDGNVAGLIATAGASDFKLIASVVLGTGTTKLTVIPETLTPARIAAEAA